MHHTCTNAILLELRTLPMLKYVGDTSCFNQIYNIIGCNKFINIIIIYSLMFVVKYSMLIQFNYRLYFTLINCIFIVETTTYPHSNQNMGCS